MPCDGLLELLWSKFSTAAPIGERRIDINIVMSQVNSEPRGRLAWRSPAEMLAAALGEDARALMGAFGIEMLAPGELDLTPGCVERARAERGEAPLAE